MDDATRVALLTWSELPHVGERRLLRIQAHARAARVSLGALAALPAARLAAELRLPSRAIRRLREDALWHRLRCTWLAERLAAAGVELCQPGDEQYPPGWAARADPPPALATLYGNAALATRPVVGLLHSRLVTEASVAATLQIVRAICADHLAIAVGGMKTPHRIAAATARALGTPRLVVLDRGLFAAFGDDVGREPFGLGPGRGSFDPEQTLVLSPFRPDDHAVARSGRRRDALLAALATLVIAVTVRPGGEIERCCQAALRRGQRVLLWGHPNPALMAGGAVPIDASDLAGGLRRWLPPPSVPPPASA
jgi:predicted Rossmann fold nucleotide-binding protein DprA/Smf involved in DNA uptake